MKKYLSLLTALVIVFILAGCGNNNTPANYIEVPPVETTPSEISADVVSSWQEVYAEILRYYYANVPLSDAWFDWHFFLHDVDKDGTPELFIVYLAAGIWSESIYRFSDGEIIPIKGDFFAYWGIFQPIDRNGIVVQAYGKYNIMVINNDELVSELAFRRPFLPDEQHWYINDVEVTEHEFAELFRSVVSVTNIFPFAVSEANIREVIFGQISEPLESGEPTNEETTEWMIKELGATIEAAGTFWNDWWWNRGRFALEHIARWGEEEVPEHLDTVYLRLLPTSGFGNINDIRNYLLQYYTESWVDAELSGLFAAFAEYDNALYIHIARMSFGDRNWETAEHVLIEGYGSHAIVETTVLVWHGEVAAYYEHQYRFTFIDGRIAYTNMQHTQ